MKRIEEQFGRRSLRLAAALAGLTALLAVATAFIYERPSVHRGLVYNIWLAMLPMLCVLAIMVLQGRRWAAAPITACSVLWLALWPNAPYMVTDLIHIQNYEYEAGWQLEPGAHVWLGFTQIVACVLVGCLWGMLSLYLMHQQVHRWKGRAAGWVFAIGACLLAGLAMYIGRFMRFNSWDAWQAPGALMAALGERLGVRMASFCLLFAALSGGMYLLFYLCFAENGEEEDGIYLGTGKRGRVR